MQFKHRKSWTPAFAGVTIDLMKVVLSKSVIDALLASAACADPHEACGILLGDGVKVTHYAAARNVHPVPASHFEIDPEALIVAHKAARGGGPAVMGYFHSHPQGRAIPSEVDERLAAKDGAIWAILGEGELSLWRSSLSGFEPLSYQVTDE